MGRDCRKDVRNPKKVIAKPRAPELALSLTPERLKDGQKGQPKFSSLRPKNQPSRSATLSTPSLTLNAVASRF